MESKRHGGLTGIMEQLPPNQRLLVLNKVRGDCLIWGNKRVMKITDSAVDALLHRAKLILKNIERLLYGNQ